MTYSSGRVRVDDGFSFGEDGVELRGCQTSSIEGFPKTLLDVSHHALIYSTHPWGMSGDETPSDAGSGYVGFDLPMLVMDG